MSEKINVTTERVRHCSSEIRRCNGELNRCLREIESTMAGLQANWQSEAGEAIRANFQAAANRYFDGYQQQVENYAKFLEQTVAGSYEATESTIKSGASAFQ